MNNMPFKSVRDTDMLDNFRNNYSNTIPPYMEIHNDQLVHIDPDLNIYSSNIEEFKSNCGILNNITLGKET